MPKQTFFNLPEDKRKKVTEAALNEFASRPYGKASLSKIVANAGISKGSMYQYFEDKKDLFLYLVDLAFKEKLAYIEQEVDHTGEFFTVFEQSMLAGTRFNIERPKLSRIIANLMESSGEDILQEIYDKAQPMVIDYYEKQLEQGKARGEIRADIDSRLIAHILYAILRTGLMDYLLDLLKTNINELLSKPELAQQLSEEKIKHLTTQIVALLRDGLSVNSGKRS